MANYNDSGNRGCRIGNWVEEETLEKVTGLARYNRANPRGTDTFSRLILHDTRLEPKEYKSATQEAFSPPLVTAPHASKGSRDRLQEQQFRKEAARMIQEACRLAEEQKLQDDVCYETEARKNFKQHAIDTSTTRIPRGRQTKNRVVVNTDDVPDVPVTFHSQRMILGNETMITPATSSNPFNKNTLFSNSVHHSDKVHYEDTISQTYVDTIDTNASNVVPGLGSDIEVDHILATAKDIVRARGGVELNSLPLSQSDSPLDAAEVWELLQACNLPLPARSRRAIAAYFEGRNESEILTLLGIMREERIGDETIPTTREFKDEIEIVFTMPDLSQSSKRVPVNPQKVRSLQLPHDDHIVRALLRRHTKLVPKSIDSVRFVC